MDKKLFLIVFTFILTLTFVFLVINEDHKAQEIKTQIPEQTLPEKEIPSNSYTIKKGLSDPFILKINQSVFIESGNIKLVFLDVTEDSRCPSNVQCIQKGFVVLNIAFLQNNKLIKNLIISDSDDENHASSITLSNYSIKLLDIIPSSRNSSEKIDILDYNATIVVKKI